MESWLERTQEKNVPINFIHKIATTLYKDFINK